MTPGRSSCARRNRSIWAAVPVLACLALAGLVGGFALAHEGAAGAVQKRMGVMKDMAASMKLLGRMVSGAEDYDADRARATADALRSHAANLADMFPEGTGHPPSEASPRIWQDWSRFRAAARSLGSRADALAVASEPGVDRDRFEAAFKAVGRSCQGCHQRFRVQRKK